VSGVPLRNLAVTDVSEKTAAFIFRDAEHAASDYQRAEHGHFWQHWQQSATACCHYSTATQLHRQTDGQFIQLILSHNKDDHI
jgi:hypothetical protein